MAFCLYLRHISLAAQPKGIYAPGGNYTSNSATKSLTGYYIGTYCKTISGLSKYNNGSNTAKIKEYDTRKSYVESKKGKQYTLFQHRNRQELLILNRYQ